MPEADQPVLARLRPLFTLGSTVVLEAADREARTAIEDSDWSTGLYPRLVAALQAEAGDAHPVAELGTTLRRPGPPR